MKHIFLNLKRFDIPKEYGGVNGLTGISEWGAYIVSHTQDALKQYDPREVEFVQYFPEAHLIGAVGACKEGSPVKVGSQGVYREDTSKGGNFGAFTTNRSANAVKAIGCSSTIVGHCEERNDKKGILEESGIKDTAAVNRILNREIKCAQAAGLTVLYCIGENSEEQHQWQQVLGDQLTIGLDGVDLSKVVIGYEPIWSIGPGKTPAGHDYIQKVAAFIKKQVSVDVVYGGGLKAENAEMLASIPEIDGGLIALTNFTGDIGFYPDEYLNIIRLYMKGGREK